MLDAETIGRIKEHYAHTNNISATVRDVGVSRKSVKKVLHPDFKRAAYRRCSAVSPAIRRRRDHIWHLCRQRSRKGYRTWPTYPSAKGIRDALQRYHGVRVSKSTVRRDLIASKLVSRVRPAVPTRTTRDRVLRRKFARRALRMPMRRIVFSDETWLTCNEQTGRRQWCKRRERPLPRERQARWNIPTMMVWAAVGYNYKSPLILFPTKHVVNGELKPFRLNADLYCDKCLRRVAVALQGKLFQQDGARAHAAKTTREYLAASNIEVLRDFPPYSPDLNMIEPLWKELADRVGALCPMTLEELKKAARRAWRELPMTVVNAHVLNFHKRLRSL
jgi:transposase